MPRLPGQRESTIENRTKLVTMWEHGTSKDEIAHIVGLSMSCCHGPEELVHVSPRLSSQEYITILEDVLLSTVRAVYPDGPILDKDERKKIKELQGNLAVKNRMIDDTSEQRRLGEFFSRIRDEHKEFNPKQESCWIKRIYSKDEKKTITQ
ncbi:hypothetical protein ILUMI_27387 [Ignelater luminosus]|uniref:Uncharacterized protein n=1 Tax=Ignelater luminosus TaxID=2038154 RepID=A0A8K0FY09_IGNLU|nr:hypothetical protein ILUMI_27387 [Ignelater luminosus]